MTYQIAKLTIARSSSPQEHRLEDAKARLMLLENIGTSEKSIYLQNAILLTGLITNFGDGR